MAGRKKILLIGDEEGLITYLTAFFDVNDFYVISSSKRNDCIQKAMIEKPDIITIDLSELDEFCAKALYDLQNLNCIREIPFIIITKDALDFNRFIKVHKQVQMPESFFERPVDRCLLLNKVNELLKA
jgi:DNA-binding NtrC family response regulator